jgi:hypothetical protein
MAPQIGPKEAATRLKNPTRLLATPVTANRTLTVRAARVETVRGILGSMVLKLFDAINDEKQVGTIDAMAKRKNITGARAPTLEIAAV